MLFAIPGTNAVQEAESGRVGGRHFVLFEERPQVFGGVQQANSGPSDDQPTARPVSMITGKYMDVEAGPNWDDDLAGSPVYASADPNLRALPPEQREKLFALSSAVRLGAGSPNAFSPDGKWALERSRNCRPTRIAKAYPGRLEFLKAKFQEFMIANGLRGLVHPGSKIVC